MSFFQSHVRASGWSFVSVGISRILPKCQHLLKNHILHAKMATCYCKYNFQQISRSCPWQYFFDIASIFYDFLIKVKFKWYLDSSVASGVGGSRTPFRYYLFSNDKQHKILQSLWRVVKKTIQEFVLYLKQLCLLKSLLFRLYKYGKNSFYVYVLFMNFGPYYNIAFLLLI